MTDVNDNKQDASATSDSKTTSSTTPSESEIYDRQIRLWGAESQAKMQNSRVLYIHITGVSSEVLKNLVLAGIAATLCDPRLPSDSSSSGNSQENDSENKNTTTIEPHFFTPPPAKRQKCASVAHMVQPLVEELNPLLGTCPILEKQVKELTADDLKPFTVVVASQISLEQAVRLSRLATANKSKFYLGDCFGWYGAALMDLGTDFQYRPEQGKQLLDPKPLDKYVPLDEFVYVPLKDCTNRFHKTPPPIYLQYRCLLEYQAQTKSWRPSSKGGDSNDNDAITLWTNYLQQGGVELPHETLQSLAKAGMAQVAPVCSVLGGMLGNEIIKVISGKGEPANNTLLLDGKTCKAWTFLVQPQKAE